MNDMQVRPDWRRALLQRLFGRRATPAATQIVAPRGDSTAYRGSRSERALMLGFVRNA